MKYVDLGDYREPGIGLFSGNPRGAAVRAAAKLDEADAAQVEVVVVVPADAFAVTSSFLSGLLGTSIRTLGKDRFRELYSFTGRPIDETVDMVVAYASKHHAAI